MNTETVTTGIMNCDIPQLLETCKEWMLICGNAQQEAGNSGKNKLVDYVTGSLNSIDKFYHKFKNAGEASDIDRNTLRMIIKDTNKMLIVNDIDPEQLLKMKTEKLLKMAFDKAIETIEPTTGKLSFTGFSGSGVNAGRVKLRSGRIALVKISIEADKDEIECECDDFESLPILDISK
ncbi:MAG: hypothetical protein JEY96_01695 [Bacteroidales bacterium]|nr:hypothetical protein [Bacteroidales bacterium]